METLRNLLLYGGVEPDVYRNCRDELRKENRAKLVFFLSIAIFFLLIAMMICCMVKSLAGGFIPYVAALAGCLALLGVTQSFPDKHMVLAICADGFLAVCYLLGIYLGCFIYADQPATCFHILAVVLPMLFTRPALWNILRTALYEGVFACCVVTFKTPEVAAMDLMDAVLFGLMACVISTYYVRALTERGGAVQAEGHRRDRPEHPDPQPQRLREPYARVPPALCQQSELRLCGRERAA